MESYKDEQWYKEIERRVEEINEWQKKFVLENISSICYRFYSRPISSYFKRLFR